MAEQQSLQSLFGIDAAVSEIKNTLVSEEFKNTLIGVGKELISQFIVDFTNSSKQTFLGEIGKVDTTAVTIAAEAEEPLSFLMVCGELISEGVSSGIKKVLGDQDYFMLVVSILKDSVYSVIEEALSDKEARLEKMLGKIGVELMSNDVVKGGFADAVYFGGKRISTDKDVQKAMATISALIVGSQDTQNMLKSTIDTGMIRVKEYFSSDDFLKKIGSLTEQNIASLQDILDVIIKEALENVMGMKISLVGTLGGKTIDMENRNG